MKSWEREQMIKEEATKEGLAQGLAEGRTEGLAQGRNETILKLSLKMSPTEIADLLDIDINEINQIINSSN